jgi:hypothetical protein
MSRLHLRQIGTTRLPNFRWPTSARLALIGGGTYLKERLAANSSAPTDLANALNAVANTVEQLGINYLNRGAADAQQALRNDLNSQFGAADNVCA